MVDEKSEQSTKKNAFSFMMKAAVCSTLLPPRFKGDTKMAQLKNDIRDYFSENEIGWNSADLSTEGISFVNTLAEALWAIDGNHSTLASRGCDVPDLFQKFKDYNRPEPININGNSSVIKKLGKKMKELFDPNLNLESKSSK